MSDFNKQAFPTSSVNTGLTKLEYTATKILCAVIQSNEPEQYAAAWDMKTRRDYMQRNIDGAIAAAKLLLSTINEDDKP